MSTTKSSRKRAADDSQPQVSNRIKPNLFPLSDYAKIYSHPPWDPTIRDRNCAGTFINTLRYYIPLKSGLTPLNPPPFSTQEEWDKYRDLEGYQRRQFVGVFNTLLCLVSYLMPFSMNRLHYKRTGSVGRFCANIEAEPKSILEVRSATPSTRQG